MLDIVRLARLALELLASVGQPFRLAMVQPLVTTAMLVFLYAGWHVRDEGSITAGLRVAFVDTTAYQAKRMLELEAAMLQAEMHRSAATDKLIDQLLTALMGRAPLATRVRLGVIHNGVTGVTGVALLRFDITNGVARPGHAVGQLITNEPLSDWNNFLPALLAGQCQTAATSAETNVVRRARLEALGAGTYMACPVTDIQHRMLGAVVATWDTRDRPPAGDELQSLMVFAKDIGVQIAAALDLGRHLPASLAGGDE